MLCQTFHMVDERKFNNIPRKTWVQKLMQSAPEAFSFDQSDETKAPFHFFRDMSDTFPSFERSLYCHLDYDMMILIICFINLIDLETGNPMLAIFLSYVIERVLRKLHRFLGERNLTSKTYVDPCFMF